MVAVTGCAGAHYEASSADAAPGSPGGYGFEEGAQSPQAPPAPLSAVPKSDDGGLLDNSQQWSGDGEAVEAEQPPSTAEPTELAPGDAVNSADVPPAKKPLLIYRAHVVLAVFETKKTLARIEALAKELGGYLLQRENHMIVIRVPATRFEEGLKAASTLGDEISRQVSAEDVSEQHRDLRIRLRNAEVVRERLEALLAKAQDVKEALLVEEQLARITNTIEQIKGRLKMLDELVAFSTITVSLESAVNTEENLKPRVTLPFPWLRELGLRNLLDLEAQ